MIEWINDWGAITIIWNKTFLSEITSIVFQCLIPGWLTSSDFFIWLFLAFKLRKLASHKLTSIFLKSVLKQVFTKSVKPKCFLLQVCHANPSERARFIRCIYNLLQSSSPAVKYEAAGTLVTLSSAPTAIKVLIFLCVS